MVTEAAKSTVSTYEIGADGTLGTITASVPNGQNTLCRPATAGDTLIGSSPGNSALTAYALDPDGKVTVTAEQAVPPSPDSRGPIDMAPTPDGRFLYVQNALSGTVDGFAVGTDGTLTPVTSTDDGLPAFDTTGGQGGMEGIAAS